MNAGSPRLQRAFRRAQPWVVHDKKKYVATQHPLPWTCEGYYGRTTTYSLLIPTELAIKILTLGTMP